MVDDVYGGYGKSILEGAVKEYKRMRLMEDAIFMNRLASVQPMSTPTSMIFYARYMKDQTVAETHVKIPLTEEDIMGIRILDL